MNNEYKSLKVPILEETVPKTITVIGRFSSNLFLTKIFDVIPLFNTDQFKAIAFKHEGLLREAADGGVVKKSDTEFKNSITMEILDRACEKIRSIKIHCAGIHMCGNRSLSRAKDMAGLIKDIIVKVNEFINFLAARSSWDDAVEDHPFYPTMLPVIKSILPNVDAIMTKDLKEQVRGFFKGIADCGGLYEQRDNQPLTLVSLNTVMINFSYNIEDYLKTHFKHDTKERFLHGLINTVQGNRDLVGGFEIVMSYDNLSSSMGWSGAVPLKFHHLETGTVQWLTLQMRKGTIVNSGPSFEIMQKAVNVLYKILEVMVLGRDSVVNVD
jgi:hypothetical protein